MDPILGTHLSRQCRTMTLAELESIMEDEDTENVQTAEEKLTNVFGVSFPTDSGMDWVDLEKLICNDSLVFENHVPWHCLPLSSDPVLATPSSDWSTSEVTEAAPLEGLEHPDLLLQGLDLILGVAAEQDWTLYDGERNSAMGSSRANAYSSSLAAFFLAPPSFFSSAAPPSFSFFTMSESPASVMERHDTRKNLPHAVPRSRLLPV